MPGLDLMTLREWSLIGRGGGGGGATKWENCGSETFCTTHPHQGRFAC